MKRSEARRSGSTKRGITLVEALMSMAVAVVGITGAAGLVTTSSRVVRHTQTRNQAVELAQRELEDVVSRGCNPDPAALCSNIQALDGRTSTVWLSSDSGLKTVAPTTPDPSLRQFQISLDVDPPYEGTERGFPRIDRPLDGLTGQGAIVNVRVTVSWLESNRNRQVAVLQTRMSP